MKINFRIFKIYLYIMKDVYILPDTGGYLYHYLILELSLLRRITKDNSTVYINIPHLKRYNQQYMYDALKYFEPQIQHIDNTDGYNKIYITEHEPFINEKRNKVSTETLLYLRNIFLKDTSYNLEKNKYIYISRNNNELLSNNQIHLPYKRRQFEIIHLENYSFEDKIKLFQTSKLIVGPEGSNLTLTLLANKDSHIIGIYYDSSPIEHNSHIANSIQVQYSLFSDITRVSSDSSGWSDNMILNIDSFIIYIRDIISKIQ